MGSDATRESRSLDILSSFTERPSLMIDNMFFGYEGDQFKNILSRVT